MIYLLPSLAGRRFVTAACDNPMFGLLLQPKSGRRLALVQRYRVWAADNGCYAAGERFNLADYLDWLTFHAGEARRCLFATAPDVVGDASATWARSADVLPQIRALGYPAALVAQDGSEDTALDWSAFDCLFIGGSTRWKLSSAARDVAQEAKRQGKWLHLGRVNSRRRVLMARAFDCDSADGTLVAFGPDWHLPRLRSWMGEVNAQLALEVPR
jgi:hypothetical protein